MGVKKIWEKSHKIVVYLLYIEWYRSEFMFESISDTFDIWACDTCMYDFDAENNLLMEIIFTVENN